jgi:hypothetical protein
MGNFAQQIHPLNDLVELRIQRINSSLIEQVYVSYHQAIYQHAHMPLDSVPMPSWVGGQEFY